MSAAEIQHAVADYLDAAGGDADEALRLAVADLLQSQDEMALTVAALDQWTSRGYVRGRATERLVRLVGGNGTSPCR
jgi:hypothetical protein